MRRTRPTKLLPPGWQAPSLAAQAQVIQDRYAFVERMRASRRTPITRSGKKR